MRVDLPTNLLRGFIAIVDSGSMVNASKHVCLTQSALSLQIKRLEELVRQPLFFRQGRRLVLTPAGEAMADYARRMLRLNDEAVIAVSGEHFNGLAQVDRVQDSRTRC